MKECKNKNLTSNYEYYEKDKNGLLFTFTYDGFVIKKNWSSNL